MAGNRRRNTSRRSTGRKRRSTAHGSTGQAARIKIEGTSTTYGQDIRLEDETQQSPLRTGLQIAGISPSDTVVNIVEETQETLETACGFVLTRLKPKSKTSVAVAAAAVPPGRVRARTSVAVRSPSFKFFNPPPPSFARIPGNPTGGRWQRRIPNSLTSALVTNAAKVTPNVVKRAVVVGSRIKPKPEIKKALEEAQKVDLTVTLKSKESESLDFNTMKIPELDLTFNYNFFEEGEENIEEQEDPTLDPLLENRPIDTPKYVLLEWAPAKVTDPVTGTELEAKKYEEFRVQNFFKPKGVAKDTTTRIPKSLDKATARIRPLRKSGVRQKIVDIHSPEEGFRSIANRYLFNNSISTTVRKSEDDNIFSLPIMPGGVRKS